MNASSDARARAARTCGSCSMVPAASAYSATQMNFALLASALKDRGRRKIPDAVRKHSYVEDGLFRLRASQEVDRVLLNKGDSGAKTRGRKVFLRLPDCKRGT